MSLGQELQQIADDMDEWIDVAHHKPDQPSFPAPPLLCKRCDGAGFVRKPAIVECTACEGRGVQ